MKMSCQEFLVLVPLLVLFGCAHLADPHRYCAGQLDKRIGGLTLADFPLPEHTPFDGTNALRQAFRAGYTDGIIDGIHVKGASRALVSFACETEEGWASVRGWKCGREDVTKRVEHIVQEFTADMTRLFSNRNQEVSFHPNGHLQSLADLRTDATGRVWRTSYTEWYENGNPSEEEHFGKDGSPCGLAKRWYRTGTLCETETLRRGVANGKCEGFYPNGERMYSLMCQDEIPMGKAKVWNDAGRLIAEGVFQDGEWTETFRAPGYVIYPPKAEVTVYPEYTEIRPQHRFSVTIDPKGPIAEEYHRFLEQAEGETNAVVEVRDDEDGLRILTGTSQTNGTHYCLTKEGKSWKVDGKGSWNRTEDSYYFYTIKRP